MKKIISAICLAISISATADSTQTVTNYWTSNYADIVQGYKKKAESGDAEAQYNLGLTYAADAQGIPHDYAQAMFWYQKSASQKYAPAMTVLGGVYSFGKLAPQDIEKAILWYKRAAEQGDTDAHVELGIMYYDGRGVPQDYVQAYAWFNVAVALGNKFAVSNRDIVLAKMSPPQVEQAQKLSQEYFKKYGTTAK